MLKGFLQSLAMYGLAHAGRNPAEAHFEEPKKSEKVSDANGTKEAALPVNGDARQNSQQKRSGK